MIQIKEHKKWMNLAFHEAEKAFEKDEVPIGSVVVQNSQIIGRGYNQCENLNDPTAHAEIIAITSAANTIKSWRLKGCSLYVTKEPCSMCAGAVVNSRLKRVVFGVYDEDKGACGSLYQICGDKRLDSATIIKGGVLEQQCKAILKEFFSLKRDE